MELLELGGDPGGEPVVLIHGLASSASAGWVATGWVRELGRSGFRPLGVDLPGHGPRAAPAPAGTTRTGLVERIRDLVQGLGASRPVSLVGYSLGAQLVWSAAAGHPGIGALVLGGLAPEDRLPALGRALADGGTPDPEVGALAAALAARGGDRAEIARWSAFARLAGAEPFAPAAAVPRQPLLLFGGGRDPWADPEAMARLRAGVRSPAELLVVPDRGHVDVLTARAARRGAVEFLHRSLVPRAPRGLP